MVTKTVIRVTPCDGNYESRGGKKRALPLADAVRRQREKEAPERAEGFVFDLSDVPPRPPNIQKQRAGKRGDFEI